MKLTTTYIIPFFNLILLTGCAISGLERAEKTTTSMEAVEEEISQIAVQLNETEASLNNLTKASDSETAEAFDSYRENVKKVVEMEDNFSKQSEEMRARGNEYFTEWQKEGKNYQNSQLREASEQRHEELSDTFEEVTKNSGEVSRALEIYINEVKEIENYLSNDLTTKGISAVAPLGEKVKENGKRVKEAINRMQDSITTAKTEMGKTGTE